MAQKKGHTGNPNGRPKGTPNKTTQIGRDFVASVLTGREQEINDALDKLKEDPAKYIAAITSLLPYVVPKKTDITTDNQAIVINLGTNYKNL